MSSSEPLIFFGTEDFSAESLRALIDSGRPIALVVTKPDTVKGRGTLPSAPKVKVIAQDAKITVLQPENLADIKPELAKINARWGVLVAYGKIVPDKILNMFKGGVINVHPSLLPVYRGPSPIETAILNGDSVTGVSLIKLVSKMDAGPVYAQTSTSLGGHETAPELYETLSRLGSRLLIDNINNIINGTLQPTPQNEDSASYTKLLSKEDGRVNWDKPAQQIERQVRAYLKWPRSTAKLKYFDVILTKVKVAKNANDGALVQRCGTGWLEIQELVAPSGRSISGADFVRGYLKN